MNERNHNEPELPRDVLAAIAMHALLSRTFTQLGPIPNTSERACQAYAMADAMLAARDK